MTPTFHKPKYCESDTGTIHLDTQQRKPDAPPVPINYRGDARIPTQAPATDLY